MGGRLSLGFTAVAAAVASVEPAWSRPLRQISNEAEHFKLCITNEAEHLKLCITNEAKHCAEHLKPRITFRCGQGLFLKDAVIASVEKSKDAVKTSVERSSSSVATKTVECGRMPSCAARAAK